MSTDSRNEEIIETFDYGTLYFIATLCRKMGVDKIFDKHMDLEKGRNPDLPHGLEAVMMIANLCDDGYRPLYLDKPERIEALCYILLIALMLLSVMEHQVRIGLKEDKEMIIGPGGVKMISPTLKAISGIFSNLRLTALTGSRE